MDRSETPLSWRKHRHWRLRMPRNLGRLARHTRAAPGSDLLPHPRPNKTVRDEFGSWARTSVAEAVQSLKNRSAELLWHQWTYSATGRVAPHLLSIGSNQSEIQARIPKNASRILCRRHGGEIDRRNLGKGHGGHGRSGQRVSNDVVLALDVTDVTGELADEG